MHQEKKMLAHISEDGTRVQTVADHLQGTAVLCGQFAAAFDAQQQGTWLGLLHDIGKYSTKFQKRLQGGEKVDHSTAGAQVAARYGQIPLAFAIAGHHSGLPDGGGRSDTAQDATMFGRLKKSVEPYTQWTNEIKLPSIPPQPEMMKENRFTQAFYTRMLYSCLVDADYLDTENFMSSPKPRGQGQTMDELLKRLNQYTAKWSHPQGTLNQRRSSILSACTTAGQTGRRGLYSLTVPTGGGKTVASLAFALSLAVKNHMDRVIYVIPYTSIIDQTADVFSEILGAENVLEHHSGVDYSAKEDDEPAAYRKALAAENWDAPVVVTTSVQFFESLYGNHASQCRKLHNIANSVVIFDEAQNLPIPYLRPCVAAIAQLAAALPLIQTSDDPEQLRGLEGEAAQRYFDCLNDLILQQKQDFVFEGRSRRPPLDNVNALLSFAYSMLARECASALTAVGLDPYVGFMHRPRPGRKSLALDLMEELRAVYADRLVISCINQKIITAKHLQKQENGAVLLTDDGRKAFLTAWQNKKKEEITHPFLKEKLPWGLVPYVQALLLARALRGDLEVYPPFFWK